MMSMADPIAIGVETLRIDSRCSLEKEFIELIRMNPLMVLYLTVNQVDFMSWLCMWSFDLRMIDIMWPISQSHFHVSCLCSMK